MIRWFVLDYRDKYIKIMFFINNLKEKIYGYFERLFVFTELLFYGLIVRLEC